MSVCMCGHDRDDHINPLFPGSVTCQDDDCPCIAWETDYNDEPTDGNELREDGSRDE